MPDARRTVRVFISSTFRDMHSERDYLITVVFPELRERLATLGLELFDVDLRWGIPETGVDGERANSWTYCKQWIDRVEPFFVCILGQRYGWVPPSEDLPKDDRRPYAGKSITEMEIRHAVLTGHLRRRSYFYLRDALVPVPLPAATVEARTAYEEFVDPPDQLARLDVLKANIRECGRPVRGYPCRWTGRGFADLERFGQIVLEDLWSGVLRDERYVSKDVWRQVLGTDVDVDPRYTDESQHVPRELWVKIVAIAKPEPKDPLDAEREQMDAFAASRLRWFHGRTDELKQLNDFLKSTSADAPRLAVVAAVPGQGKSALLAQLHEQLKSSPYFVITHFVGSTERSASAHTLVERLLGELDRSGITWPAVKQAERQAPKRDLNSLCLRLAQRLGDYEGERRIVVLLDALNQLTDGYDLQWLPTRLGPSVRVIVSCVEDALTSSHSPIERGKAANRPGEGLTPEQSVLHALKSRQPAPLPVQLGPLTDHDVRAIVVAYLKEYCKELDTPHVDSICDKQKLPQAHTPLYLLVMLAELRTIGGNDLNRAVPALIASMPQDHPDAVSLFQWVLERLAVLGAEEVRCWCLYLARGRVGMASRELADLLSRKLGPHASAVALRIERAIRPYLLRRGQQLDYCHAELKRAVERSFPCRESDSMQIHADLAQYFHSLGLSSHRMLAETPYHQCRSQVWDGLSDTLCNVDFIAAKARAGMADGLLADYQACEWVRSRWDDEGDRDKRIAEYVNQLIEHDRNPELVPLPIPPPSISLDVDGQAEDKDATTTEQVFSEHIRAWSHFVSHHTAALVRGEIPAFQLAYNSASAGPVQEAMHRRIASPQPPNRPWMRLVNRPVYDARPACVCALDGHSGDVCAVAITPDGKLGVSGCSHAELRVWDLTTGKCLHVSSEGQGVFNTMVITPDGRLAAAGSVVPSEHFHSVCIWNIATGRVACTLHPGLAMVLRITADGRYLVTRSGGRVVRTWDLSVGGQCIATRNEPGALPANLMTPDKRWGVCPDPDRKGMIQILDLASGRCDSRLQGHEGHVNGVTITHDGQLVVSGGGDGCIRLWDRASGRCLRVFRGHTGSVGPVAATPDGRWILSGSDKTVRLWDVARRADGQCDEDLQGHSPGMYYVGASADGRLAISSTKHNTAHIWDVSEGRCLQVLRGHAAEVSVVAITADGKDAISGSEDTTVRTWSTATGECRRILRGHSGGISEIAVSLDGRRIVSLSKDKTLRVWDALKGCCLGVLTDNISNISGVTLSVDCRFALAVKSNSDVLVWDLSTLRLVRTLEQCAAEISGGRATLGLLPDGTSISSPHPKNNRIEPVRIWNPLTGTIHKTITRTSYTRMFYVVPDGRRAIFVGFDPTLLVCNLRTGSFERLVGHGVELNGGIRSVAIAPDGQWAVSGSFDKTVRVWDLGTSRCLGVHLAPGGAVESVRVGVSGIAVDTACGMEFLQLENAPPIGPLVLTLSRLWLFGPDGEPGHWDAPLSATCPACGRRFEPTPAVVDVMTQIHRNCPLAADRSACLALPDEAWDEPGLLSACPYCHKSIRYNPFVADNSHFDLVEDARRPQPLEEGTVKEPRIAPSATVPRTSTGKIRSLFYIACSLVIIAVSLKRSLQVPWFWIAGIPAGLCGLIMCGMHILVVTGHLGFFKCPKCRNTGIVWRQRRRFCGCPRQNDQNAR